MKDYYIIKYRNNISNDDIDVYKLNIIYVRSLELFDDAKQIKEYIEIAKSNNQIVLVQNNSPAEDISSSSESEEEELTTGPVPQIVAVVYDGVYNINIDEYINSIINGNVVDDL